MISVLQRQHVLEDIDEGLFVDENLTEGDCSLISAPAATAIDFEQWFEAFSERIYREGLERRVLRRYHAGLLLSHRPTFLTASRSLIQLSQNGSLGQVHSTAEFYEASRQFLAEQSLAHVAFEGVGHWIMREAEQDFYQRLGGLAQSSRAGKAMRCAPCNNGGRALSLPRKRPGKGRTATSTSSPPALYADSGDTEARQHGPGKEPAQ